MGKGMCSETVPRAMSHELKRDSVRGPLLCELNLCSKKSPKRIKNIQSPYLLMHPSPPLIHMS